MLLTRYSLKRTWDSAPLPFLVPSALKGLARQHHQAAGRFLCFDRKISARRPLRTTTRQARDGPRGGRRRFRLRQDTCRTTRIAPSPGKTLVARPKSRPCWGRDLSRGQNRVLVREDAISGLRQASWCRIGGCRVVPKTAFLAKSGCRVVAKATFAAKNACRIVPQAPRRCKDACRVVPEAGPEPARRNRSGVPPLNTTP